MRTLVQKGSRVLHAIMPAVYLTSHAKCALSMLDGHKGQKQNLCPVCLLCTEDVQCVLWVQKVPGASFFKYRLCPVCPILDVQEVFSVCPMLTEGARCFLFKRRQCSVCPGCTGDVLCVPASGR